MIALLILLIYIFNYANINEIAEIVYKISYPISDLKNVKHNQIIIVLKVIFNSFIVFDLIIFLHLCIRSNYQNFFDGICQLVVVRIIPPKNLNLKKAKFVMKDFIDDETIKQINEIT
jgi:hypothetical protein